MASNLLYYGDNLDVLCRYIDSESVDLVYLDPPFSSNATYNAFFAEQDGTRAAAQIKAFEDTWRWDSASSLAFEEFAESGPERASLAMQSFRDLLGDSDMLAYLAMIAPRLVELRRVLKPTGSLYLHCDLTASHYLKLLLDAIFGTENFLNEITWKRTTSHGNVGRNFGSMADTILVYVKTQKYKWNQQYCQYSAEYVRTKFTYKNPDGRVWRSVTLRNPSRRPNLHYPYTASDGNTYYPHPNGWSCKRERLERYDRENRLHFPAKPGGQLNLKMYLDELPGVKLQNIWVDIPPINSQAAERLGYPTQKPEALLERIIGTNSNEGDTVLDPFCGCGTAVAVSQYLNRRWIGIDITHLAIGLVKSRLHDSCGDSVAKTYKVVGEPVSLYDAATLASEDRFQFQCWALGLIPGARPAGSEEIKKGADKGVDGRFFFHDEGKGGKTKQMIISVKSGKTDVTHMRDLRGVVDREKAAIGVLITLQESTKPMREEAASAGFYSSPWGKKYPRLQILTIAELLDGKTVEMPPWREIRTFKKAPRVKREEAGPPMLFGTENT